MNCHFDNNGGTAIEIWGKEAEQFVKKIESKKNCSTSTLDIAEKSVETGLNQEQHKSSYNNITYDDVKIVSILSGTPSMTDNELKEQITILETELSKPFDTARHDMKIKQVRIVFHP